jgi:uncharacterized protein (TIGR02145 family)
MKKVILLITGLLLVLTFSSFAQQQAQMKIHKTGGQIDTYNISDIDSVTFVDCNTNKDTICEVKISNQVWMCKNLDVDHYRNGDIIPQVTDPTAWNNLTSGAWCYYNNDSAMGAIYGKLYNWYAVNDPRGLAPSGWQVPSDSVWKTLEMNLGMSQAEADKTDWRGTNEGGKLKETGTLHWLSPNTGATNESDFTALPGGYRNWDGTFDTFKNRGCWWVSTGYDATRAWYRILDYTHTSIFSHWGASKNDAHSVRCVKD